MPAGGKFPGHPVVPRGDVAEHRLFDENTRANCIREFRPILEADMDVQRAFGKFVLDPIHDLAV